MIYETYEDEAMVLLNRIRPLLGGKPPPLQGIVVAELMAVFIAGFAPELRDEILGLQLDMIRKLVPLWHEAIRGEKADGNRG